MYLEIKESCNKAELLQQAELAFENERISYNQVLYHLGYRVIEKRLVPYCKSKEIAE